MPGKETSLILNRIVAATISILLKSKQLIGLTENGLGSLLRELYCIVNTTKQY